MNTLKREVLNKLSMSYKLLCLSALLLCACTDVTEHCSDHNPLDPFKQFCYQGKAVDRCDGKEYNPSTQFCYQSKTLMNKCGGAEYNPSTQGCYGGVVRSDANVLTVGKSSGGSVSIYPNQTSYKWGTSVTVTANAASGYTFTGWSGASTSADTVVTIVMDSSKTLIAEFQPKVVTPPDSTPNVTPPDTTPNVTPPATYAVTVNSAGTGAIGAGSYAAGAQVNINAGTAPAGQVFKNWTTTSNGVTFANAGNSSTSFTMPSNNVAVTANFEAAKYTVTVTSAGTNATGNGSYTAGAMVNITAGTAPAGQVFKNWTTTSNGVTFANAGNSSTSFTMPSNNVAVTANFEAAKYTVTVTSAGTNATGNGSYTAGAMVNITAGTAPAGQVFKNWTTTRNGVTFANADNSSTSFTMPANNVTVTANFEAANFDVDKIEMIYVPGGTFTMGCTDNECSYGWETPSHQVTLTRDYYIGKYEVTQGLWKAVMGSSNNPSFFKGDSLPVENVSWNDIVNDFLPALNRMTNKNYRLPTEAEWEFAARGGVSSNKYKYSGSDEIKDVAWYRDNSGSKTHKVGTKKGNELGIHDMNGNVWEWVNDWYGDYSDENLTDPNGPEKGSPRVIRGGSWDFDARGCRVSFRNYSSPDYRYLNIGFRLVLLSP